MAVISASPAVVFEGARRISLRRPALAASPVVLLALAGIGAFLVTLVVSMAVGRPVPSGTQAVPSGPLVAESIAHPAWTVVTGDSLWSIAQSVRPEADPRAVVLQIQVLNDLSADHVLQAGEVLQVPAA